MFDWKVKDIKATNAIFLGEKTEEEGRPFKARFLQAGLVKYDFGVCLLKKETIDRFVNTFIDCPVIINHKDDIKKEDRQGTIKSIWFAPEDGWFWCSGVLDEEAAKKVEKDGFNVSCQYRITEYSNNTENKLHNGNPYDKEILNGVFEHLAIVKSPRYEDAYIAVNAIEWAEEEMKASNEEMKANNGFITIDGGTEDERVIWVPFEVLSEKARKHITEIADNYKEGDETKFDFSHTRVKPTEEQINYLKDTLKEIQNKYKFKGVAQIEISSELNKGSLGVCASPDNCSIIALSPQLYNGKHDQERWNKSVESGFHPKGTGEMIKSVLVHELGHAITCNSKNDKFWSEIEGIRKEYMKDIKKKDIQNPNFISGYARTNKYEFVAEAFSQGMLAKTYGKYTKRVMETIDKHFKSGNQIKTDLAKNETSENENNIWLEEYGLGYPIDEEAFEEFNKEQERKTNQTASNSFLDSFKDFVYNRFTEELNDRLGELTASNEERWITIHPHGKSEDGENDYRRLKIEDGETIEDAMHRQGYYDKRKVNDELKKKVEEKIKTLEEKAKKVGGDQTVLGRKYLAEAEALRKGLKDNGEEKKPEDKKPEGQTPEEQKPEEKKPEPEPTKKTDEDVIKDIEKLSEQYNKVDKEYWGTSWSDTAKRELLSKQRDKIKEELRQVSTSLSTVGKSWKDVDGATVTFKGYDPDSRGFKIETTGKFGHLYSYFSNYSSIEKLEQADTKGYEKKQKNLQEASGRRDVKWEAGKMPKAKSVEEATQLAIKYGLADKVNYGKLSVDICNAMNESANDVLSEFPEIRPYCKEFGSLQGTNKSLIDEAVDIQGESIAVRIRDRLEEEKKRYGEDYFKRYYGDNEKLEKAISEKVTQKIKNLLSVGRASGEIAHCKYSPPKRQGIVWNEKFKNSEDFDYTVGFHPEGGTSLKAICDHEFGHQIDHFIKDAIRTKSSNSYNELKRWYNSLSGQQINDELSRYATTNMAEWIAEGFCEYKNNKNCRPMAKKIGELLTAAYKEVTNG